MTDGATASPFSWRPFAPWALLFALLGAPLVLSTGQSNLSSDEASYYLPAIRQIREHWPRLDLVGDSLSATGPGYSYFLATVSLLTGTSTPALRAVNWCVSLGVLAVLWSMLRRRGGISLTLALAPLAFSNFFVKSTGWVVTDNAALLLTSLALGAVLFDSDRHTISRAAVAAAAAVTIRQVAIWLVAPLALRVWTDGRGHRLGRSLWLLLPITALACLVLAWHGAVPPAWRQAQIADGGLSLAPAAYLLGVLATMGAPFYFAASTVEDWRDAARQPWLRIAAAAGVALALVAPTTPNMGAGRWGGYWWSIAAHLPSVGHVSLLFLVLVPSGAVVAAALLRLLWRRRGSRTASLWAGAAVAWMATTLVNRLVFHRYFEPPLLVFLIAWIALLAGGQADFRLARRWPLVVLALLQLLTTVITTYAQAFLQVRFA